MSRPYAPLALANQFIKLASADHGPGAEHMKLQKLVYCAHGWWLVFQDTPIVSEEPEVWRHGPVFDSLYHVLKPFGHRPIATVQSPGPFEEAPLINDADADAHSVVKWTWRRYGQLSSFDLSAMTHKVDTPWHRVAKAHNFRVPRHTPIPADYIRDEFQAIYQKEAASVA